MRKILIDIIVKISTKGEFTPLQIIWEDGRVFTVDKLLYKTRAASLVGGCGDRYTVLIGSQQRHIFRARDTGVWFVEGL